MSVSFLASLMVKLHEGVAWSTEEVETLRVAAGLLQVHTARESVRDPKDEKRPDEKRPDEKRPIKKIKTVESQQNTPIPTQLVPPPVEEFVLDTKEVPNAPKEAPKIAEVPKEESRVVEVPKESKVVEVPKVVEASKESKVVEAPKVAEVPKESKVVEAPKVAEVPKESKAEVPKESKVPAINPTYCIARKVSKDALPGTDANPVYKVKQCPRLHVKGDVLCSKCTEFLEEWQKNPKKKSKWEGILTETPLDNLHVEGSKWFHEKYPHGISPNMQNPVQAPVQEMEPQQECVLVSAPVQEVKWAALKVDGIHYMYNLRDRRVYRADITKEGEDRILWDSYEGKWRNGEIDPYCKENEDECD